jgi:TetR/AcrR family transcriptional regulator
MLGRRVRAAGLPKQGRRQLRLDATSTSAAGEAIVETRRRQKRAINTREKIMAAAFTEFSEHGFEGASTRTIAKNAHVQHRLVLYHFGSKDGLWQALMVNAINDYRRMFDLRLEGLRGVDELTKLRLIQEEFIRFAAKRPEFHWLMSYEARRQEGARLDWLVANLVAPSFAAVIDLIRSAQSAGRYVKGDPVHVQYAFISVATRIFMLAGEVKAFTGHDPFRPEFIEEHIELCTQLFFRD